MMNWTSAAGLCLNKDGQLLMLLQGAPEDEKKWSVPAVMIGNDESMEDAVKQEFSEVTGCTVSVSGLTETKPLTYSHVGIQVTMYYYAVELASGTPAAPAGDELVAEVAWKSGDEIKKLPLMYPEERDLLIDYTSKMN